MHTSLTATEIASKLDVSKRTVHLWARDENWPVAQGSVKKYPLHLMPAERQRILFPATPETRPKKSPELPPLSSLKGWQRTVMDARLALFNEFKRLEKKHNSTSKAIDIFTTRAKRGVLPEHLQKLVKTANARGGKNGRAISKSMIYRWKTMEKQGLAAFAPQVNAAKKIPAWAPYFLKCFQIPQKPSIPEAMQEMTMILPQDITMPSYYQVRRWNNSRSRLDVQRGRHSAGALKRFKGFCRRSTDNMVPLDVVQCDGHSFKSKVANPFHGRPFKPEVCAVIDVKTKICLGWSAGLAESAHTVADALRHSMTVNDQKPWGGVPAILYTDKGAGNMAKMLNDEMTGILSRAGITHHTGIPGNAQGRGLVEKTNQKLWISAARKLKTFVGKGMDALEQRDIYLLMDKDVRKNGTCTLSELPTWEQFMAICEQSMLDYNNTPHSGLKKIKDLTGRIRHMTPAEAWFTAIREGWKPVLLDTAILDDLYRPQVVHKTRRAEVHLFNKIYFNPVLAHYHDEKVIIEYDIHDPRTVRVRDMEQRLVCLAQIDRNKRDFFPVSEVERSREQRAKGRIKLLENKIEEVKAERDGTLQIEADDSFLIEADAGAVDRMLERTEDDIIVDVNPVNPGTRNEYMSPDLESMSPDLPPQQLVSTKSEQFNLLLDELRKSPRPLTAEECEFLGEYYQEDGGRMYLTMVGDLRIEYGVAPDGELKAES